MWWLNKGQREIPGLPDHIYYAAGFGGNFIVVDEKEDLVIVTRWLNPPVFNDFMTKVYAAIRK
jgi:CubicO group peptidase (beta-lactamase class C family)